MQSQQQKHLQTLIQGALNDSQSNIGHHAQQIVKIVSSRVDMPKHLINYISKRLSIKQQQKISIMFDILWYVTQKYQNKISLFNQISTNKQFLFKITSILGIKDLNQNLKVKIIDIVYEWKELFKNNKQLFPNFWNFYTNFQKKGYTPSNLNFQTRYLQNNQNALSAQQHKQNKQTGEKNIFDLMEGNQQSQDYSKIQKHVLIQLYRTLQKIKLQNTIISNTSPQILDIPPILRQGMSQIKIMQQKLNKYINEHKNKITNDTILNMIRLIQLTQKRYTQLITKYLPVKFQLSQKIIHFENYCIQNNIKSLLQSNQLTQQINLLDINDISMKKTNNDLLDLDLSNNVNTNQVNANKGGIKNFFGNLLDKVNSSNHQVNLSTKPIQDDFKTDLDFIQYKDSKTIQQHYDYVRNLTAQKLAQDFFKL